MSRKNNSTQILSTLNLSSILSDSYIFVDTCSLVNLSKNIELRKFFLKILPESSVLASVPPVSTEFLSVADNLKEQQSLGDFLRTMGVLFTTGIEQKFTTQEANEFLIAMRRSNTNKPSYVDKLLLFAAYFYRNSNGKIYIMTSNHKDIPSDFFDRRAIIVSDNGREIQCEGFYAINTERLSRMTQSINALR